MMIKKRMPFQALQKAVCEFLKKYQTSPVYEYITLKTKPPYVTFGDIQVESDDTKDASIIAVDVEIDFYSIKHTRSEINGMMNDVATLLSSFMIGDNQDGCCIITDVSDPGNVANFVVLSQAVLNAETSPSESDGYSGALHVQFTVQDIGPDKKKGE